MYKTHRVCRACSFGGNNPAPGSKAGEPGKLFPVFSLGVQPLANDFCNEAEPRSGYAPLDVLLCPKCGLAQLSIVVDPDILYRHYRYVTSPSQTMKEHFIRLQIDLSNEIGTDAGKKLLEIGSNDGALLEAFKGSVFTEVLGVDPANNLVHKAIERGVKSIRSLWTPEVAAEIKLSGFVPDLIIARHVFCHADDWHGFITALQEVSGEHTLIAIEVPYVRDMLKNTEFDTIYHEHLSYFSLHAMDRLLENSQFHLHRINRYPIHGGALLVMLRHRHFPQPAHESVLNMLTFERATCIVDQWDLFRQSAEDSICNLKIKVSDLVDEGKTVAALGASAKSTVWINACGFTRKQIKFIADTTPEKLYKFSPGSDIPIIDEGAILRELPDYVVCFCWNFREEVLKKNELARSKGVKFIFPVPNVEIV